MDDRLLRRYIMDAASRSERMQVVEWINESRENLEHFAALKAKYVFAGLPDTIIPERRPVIRSVIVGIAASLTVPLLAGGIWLYLSRKDAIQRYVETSRQVEMLLKQNDGMVTYIANPGTKSLITLPDSSVVRLNGATTLRVPSRFDTNSRELYLSGEGYFDIRHHEDWPMNIHTSKGVVVKVLGTTFNLSSYDNDEGIKLTLIEGKVVVKDEKTGSEHLVRPLQEIKLAPQSSVSTSSNVKAVIKKANVQLNTAWVNGELVFDNTPMPEIIKQLERWYGVHVHVSDPEVLNYRLTGTFTTESITRVLDLIRFSSMLQYSINGQEVYIRKAK